MLAKCAVAVSIKAKFTTFKAALTMVRFSLGALTLIALKCTGTTMTGASLMISVMITTLMSTVVFGLTPCAGLSWQFIAVKNGSNPNDAQMETPND